jgi:hypothetical protein
MPLLQEPIQRKLSALLGAECSFEKLNFSLLGGSIDASGVKISADAKLPAVLTIARVRAQVAIGRALKGEIVITSLTIEKPVLNFVRLVDGTSNLPKRFRPAAQVNAPARSDAGGELPDTNRWKLDATKVLLIDGALSLNDESLPGGRYQWSAGPILAELNRTAGGYSTTLIADNVCQLETTTSVGSIRLNGSFDNAADLTAIPRASANLMVEIGSLFKGKIISPSLASKVIELTGHGGIDAKQLIGLLPPGAVPPALASLSGQLQFDLSARNEPASGITVSELNLRGVGLGMKLPF